MRKQANKLGAVVLALVMMMGLLPLAGMPRALANSDIGLHALTVENDSVALRWDRQADTQPWDYESNLSTYWNWDNDIDSSTYHIERSDSPDGIYSWVGSTADKLTYTDLHGSLVPGKTYYYRVPFMISGVVFRSNVLTATLKAVLPPVLTTTNISNGKVDFKWVSIPNGRAWDYETNLSTYYNWDNDIDSSTYHIERSDSPDGIYLWIGSTADKLTYTDNNVVPNKTYYYRVSCMVSNTIFTSNPLKVSTPKMYTVIFKNGSTILSNLTVEHGKAATAPSKPTKIGYTFNGWDKNFNKVTQSMTVNAKWKINNVTLTFNANGGKIGKKKIVKVKTTYKKKIKLPNNPKYKGYKFKGWYSSSWGGEKITKKTKAPADNATYYARWVRK